MNQVLVDTGPLVALVRPKDQYHHRAAKVFRELRAEFLTCWPVLTEVAWLLRDDQRAWDKILLGLDEGLWRISELDHGAIAWVRTYRERYPSLKPQLADLCLAYIAERDDQRLLFTFDRRDFSVLRLRGKTSLTLIP